MADAICNNCIYFKEKAGGFGDCILRDRTVHWQEKYCNCFRLKDNYSRENKSMAKDFLEEHFVKGAKGCGGPEDILNWYRNLYYKEEEGTERRIVAEALNEFFNYKLPTLLEEARNESKNDKV